MEPTLEQKKATLYTPFKNDPDVLTSRLSEVVFDLTELIQYTPYRDRMEDSRAVWQDVLAWAWEFEYEWTYNIDQDNTPYGLEVQDFLDKKLKEEED